MRARNTEQGWGWITRMLHWVIAGLIFFQIGLGIAMTRDSTDLLTRFDQTQLHKSWGAVIFLLVLLRLLWRRVGGPRPALPPDMPGWQRRAARGSHILLYTLMLLLPISGWVQAAAAPEQDLLGIENRVFGYLVLPDPWQPGVGWLAEAARAMHAACAWTLAAVVILHAGAAIHHAVRRHDGVLTGMVLGASDSRKPPPRRGLR